MERTMSMMREFLRLEAAGGILLIAAAALAMIMANTPLWTLYDDLLEVPLAIQVGDLIIAKPLLLWINDGLMAVFFLLVGLEVKRELVEGELSSWDKAALPVVGAVGGMAVPALVFVLINWKTPVNLDGWAIPAATDIAFALGILSLIGKRAPTMLKIFLLALAIIDDLGAIVIIAIFYTANLSLTALVLALAGTVVLAILNARGVTRLAPYVLVGVFIWVCVLKSGVHATLAGVAVAFFIPLKAKDAEGHVPAKHLEHILHPWVSFAIMPIFAFANAGLSFEGLSFASLLEPLPLGIAAGLFLGKQVGVMGFAVLAVMVGLARLPEGTTWPQFYGVALLTGIGFTMSLFIGTLAYEDASYVGGVRLGVLSGSLLSALFGYLVLRATTAGRAPETEAQTRAAVEGA